MISRTLLPLMLVSAIVMVYAALTHHNEVSAFYAWGALILTAMVMNFDVKRKRR